MLCVMAVVIVMVILSKDVYVDVVCSKCYESMSKSNNEEFILDGLWVHLNEIYYQSKWK